MQARYFSGLNLREIANWQLRKKIFFLKKKKVLNAVIYQNWVLWMPCQGAFPGTQHLAQMAHSTCSLNIFMSESGNTKC